MFYFYSVPLNYKDFKFACFDQKVANFTKICFTSYFYGRKKIPTARYFYKKSVYAFCH
jgi:hypothetical protein